MDGHRPRERAQNPAYRVTHRHLPRPSRCPVSLKDSSTGPFGPTRMQQIDARCSERRHVNSGPAPSAHVTALLIGDTCDTTITFPLRASPDKSRRAGRTLSSSSTSVSPFGGRRCGSSRHLRHAPSTPNWFNRDRFVLSNGHASALLYSLLHLAGYGLTLDDLKAFRQWGSLTPGHPEYGLTAGVEATTGPLGQGFANGVGMAIAERRLAAEFNRPGHEVHVARHGRNLVGYFELHEDEIVFFGLTLAYIGKRIGPWLVCASKSGTTSLIRSDMVWLLLAE